MEQRKTFNKQTTVRPLDKESGLADAENRKPEYVSPQVSVVYVELESAVAASITSATTPTVTDWQADTGSGDINIY
jgi:hypothetical protein